MTNKGRMLLTCDGQGCGTQSSEFKDEGFVSNASKADFHKGCMKKHKFFLLQECTPSTGTLPAKVRTQTRANLN